MKKLYIPVLLILICTATSYSQQADIEHFISVPIEINPAYVGAYHQFNANAFISRYELGLFGVNKKFKANTDLSIKSINSGFGIMYQSEESAYFKVKCGRFAYSYLLQLNNLQVNLGIGANYYFKYFWGDWMSPEGGNTSFNETRNQCTLSGGLFLHNKNYYLSLSYCDIEVYSDSGVSTLHRNGSVKMVTGYHFFKDSKLSFCPSLLVDVDPNYHTNVMLNFKAIVMSKVWMSATIAAEEYYELGAGINILNYYAGVRNKKYFSSFNNNSEIEIFTGFYFDKK